MQVTQNGNAIQHKAEQPLLKPAKAALTTPIQARTAQRQDALASNKTRTTFMPNEHTPSRQKSLLLTSFFQTFNQTMAAK